MSHPGSDHPRSPDVQAPMSSQRSVGTGSVNRNEMASQSKNQDTTGVFSTMSPDAKSIAASSDKDPFISPETRDKREARLNATASAFQPFNSRLQNPFHGGHPGNEFSPPNALMIHPMEQNTVPTPFFAQFPPVMPMYVDTAQPGLAPGTMVKVRGAHGLVDIPQVQQCLQQSDVPGNANRLFYDVSDGALIAFSDVNDAATSVERLKQFNSSWDVSYAYPAQGIEPQPVLLPATESPTPAQVFIIAKIPPTLPFHAAKLEEFATELLKADGEMRIVQKRSSSEDATVRMVVEYLSTYSAMRAVERLNGSTVRGVSFKIGLHKAEQDPWAVSNFQNVQGTPNRPSPAFHDISHGLATVSLSSPVTYDSRVPVPVPYGNLISPAGRPITGGFPVTPNYSASPYSFGGPTSSPQTPVTGWTSGGYGTPSQVATPYAVSEHSRFAGGEMSPWPHTPSPSRGGFAGSPRQGRSVGRRQNAVRGGSRPQFNSPVGQHNIVDVDRIRQGLDVRTTIMLRNIPNKIDQAMLKSIIDETSFGLYDFMYLRIDFANNCNVGYAFINFEDPWHIIGFVEARAGQRWFNSDKVAEVSYATIQGKDCLVQKFRNSSVMLEDPTFRPKIFYTRGHSREGEEEDFPLPDNVSKMRRSVENAEHVGLFAPRAGQHYRDEQRRRRSQYDRGTRLAALEEFEGEEPVMYGADPHYSI